MNEELDRQVNAIVRRLGSLRKSTREQAERELKALGPDAVEPIIEAIKRASMVGLRIYSPLGCLLWMIGMSLSQHLKSQFTVYIVLFIPYGYYNFRNNRFLIYANRILTELEDPRAVGRLIDTIEIIHPYYRLPILKILRHTLARLSLETLSLSNKQLHALADLLPYVKRDNELIGYIFTVLVSVGDTYCLRCLGDLLARTSAKRPGKKCIDKVALKVSIQALTDRLEREWPARTLLRPSEAPESSTLLRPAGNAPIDDALLRPVEAPNAEQPLGGARGE